MELLDKLSEIKSELDFNNLIQFIHSESLPVYNAKLANCFGLTIFDGIYIDVEKVLIYANDRLLYFVILHEIAHYKRIKKLGKQTVIDLLSLEDINEFTNHIIGEELIADRYASMLFHVLTQRYYPKYETQQLDNPLVVEHYKETTIPSIK